MKAKRRPKRSCVLFGGDDPVDVMQLVFGEDFLFDDPSRAVAVLAFALFDAVIDAAQAAAGFADADFHRFLVEGKIFAQAVERELLLERLDENAPRAVARPRTRP